jgi:hypothetical protein
MGNIECPPESAQWLAIIEATLQKDEDILLMVANFISKISSLLRRARNLVCDSKFGETASSLPLILEELDVAEGDILAWARTHPEYFLAARPIYQYFMKGCRAAQIKAHHFIILLLNLVEYAPPDTLPVTYDPRFLSRRRQKSLKNIASQSLEILDGSLALLMVDGLGPAPLAPSSWIDGMQLVWPLTCVMCVPTVPKESRAQARYILGLIGRQRGILQALKSYPGGLQLPPEAMTGIPVDDVSQSYD